MLHQPQLPRNSEAAAMAQNIHLLIELAGPCPHKDGSSNMRNAKVMEAWQEGRQNVVRLEPLKVSPEKAGNESGRVTLVME